METPKELSKVQEAASAFPARFQTLYLGTVSHRGQPEASYAPYVFDEGKFYVYLSGLARHANNLKSTGKASVLFIEEESSAKHVFGRERLTFACHASAHERGSLRFDQVLNLFDQRFGKFMQVIRPLEDFTLFELTPESGSYVAGFAKAYVLDGQDLRRIRHRNDQGHTAPNAAALQRLDEEITP